MDSKYKQEVQKYGKKDALIALCAFVAFCVLTVLDWVFSTHFDIQSAILPYLGRIIGIAIVLIIVFVKKEGLSSIGFHTDKLKQALGFTLVIVLAFIAFGIIPGLIHGWEFNNLGVLIPVLLTTFIMAAGEDIFFVGYLQPRLHGLFKNTIFAIFVGAVCFAIAHVPIGILDYTFPMGWGAMWLVWMFGHTVMVLIFRRQFSIIPVIITHTLGNFFMGGSLWVQDVYDYDWSSVALLLIFLTLTIYEIVIWRRRGKRERAT